MPDSIEDLRALREMAWTAQAGELADLAEQARIAGDLVTMIGALTAAAQCLQIARNLEV